MSDLQNLFLEYPVVIRAGCFLLLIMLFLLLEIYWPGRVASKQQNSRRLNNAALLGVDFIAVRLFVPFAAYELALITAERDLGLFNLLQLPFFLNVLLTIVIFDLLIYVQHVLFHRLDILWRVHRVHHTDLEVDVTTGIRFHPIEIVFSLFYKILAVYLLGPAAFAVVLYEIVLNSASLFTHSNIRLNKKFDAILRKVFVTPDMHRIHHSAIKYETNSNYGNLFSFWDKLFGTYRKQATTSYEKMIIGLDEFRDPLSGNVLQLLKNPFMKSGSPG